MTVLMCDHPGWTKTGRHVHRVLTARPGGPAWHLRWAADDGGLTIAPGEDETGGRPVIDTIDVPARTVLQLSDLIDALNRLGTVRRVRTADLWEAIGTAVIRQVIRADQARQMYARFCTAHGRPVPTAVGPLYLFPDAAVVAGLPPEAFAALGMAFKSHALTAAAAAYLQHADRWAALAPPTLVEALQAVPRIGPWTAGAAVADHTGDYGCYPYADLAVRTWARHAAPHTDWPHTEPVFAARWRQDTGAQLPALTLLTLAWGDHHVRTARPHPDQRPVA